MTQAHQFNWMSLRDFVCGTTTPRSSRSRDRPVPANCSSVVVKNMHWGSVICFDTLWTITPALLLQLLGRWCLQERDLIWTDDLNYSTCWRLTYLVRTQGLNKWKWQPMLLLGTSEGWNSQWNDEHDHPCYNKEGTFYMTSSWAILLICLYLLDEHSMCLRVSSTY